MKLEFSRQIFEKGSYIKFHQNRPVGAELFHEGGPKDMKLIVAFLNYANARRNWRYEGTQDRLGENIAFAQRGEVLAEPVWLQAPAVIGTGGTGNTADSRHRPLARLLLRVSVQSVMYLFILYD
jgi:hypothetical protein